MQSQRLCLLPVLLALLAAAPCAGFSSGPPAFTCLNGQPMHFYTDAGARKMHPPYVASPPLYSLTANATQYAPNDVVQVELLPGKESKFEGFLIRAMRVGARPLASVEGPLVGRLQCWNSMNATMRMHSVYSPTNATNCITHASEKDYTWLRCLWTAPATNEGPVVFVATAVEDYNKYEHLMSGVMNSTLGMPPLTDGLTEMKKMPSMYGCGTTKTCALYPAMCDTRGGCTHGVMMTELSSGKLLFEAFGATDQWIGVGIADSTEMEDMELYWCSYSANAMRVTVETSYSPYEAVIPVYRPMVEQRSAMAMYNQSSSSIPPQPTSIACSFVRPRVDAFRLYKFVRMANVIETISSDMQKGKFVVLAQGSMIGARSRQMARHPFKPLKSPMKFKTGSKDRMYFGGLSATVKTHATLMTIAWMFLAGFAIVIARHSRPVFNQKLVLQKDLWFLLHIAFMVICFIMAAAGVIYMLVRHKGWESDAPEQTHGIIGLIGLGLALINVVMGIFRPEPDAKFRWVFNRLHRYNGLLAVLFSGIAMWLGAVMPENRPEFRFWAVIVLGVWTGVMLLGMMVFECLRQAAAKNEEVKRAVENKYRMQNMKAGEPDDQQLQQEDDQAIKGKRVRHVPSVGIVAFGVALLAVSAAFWAGLWLH